MISIDQMHHPAENKVETVISLGIVMEFVAQYVSTEHGALRSAISGSNAQITTLPQTAIAPGSRNWKQYIDPC